MNRRRSAFTLVELLVVIGIIGLLMSILIPVVSRLRIAQQNASTTNQMHRISMAITNYYNDFQAFPGAFSNQAFATPATGITPKLSGLTGAKYTQTEDCVLALLGGLRGSATGTVTWTEGDVGAGPMSYSAATSGLVNKRYNAYMEYRAEDFTPRNVKVDPANPSQKVVQFVPFGSGDTEAPDFMDQFSTARPIVYLRANIGAKNDGTRSVYNSKGTSFDSTSHYDLYMMAAYLNVSGATDKRDFKMSDVKANPSAEAKNAFTVGRTLGDPVAPPSTPGVTARNAGSYMLIDAGVDRVFGTVDDIVIGSGGGQ